MLLVVLLLSSVVYLFVSCGGSSTTNADDNDPGVTGTPQYTTIDELPTALTRVVSAETATSLSALVKPKHAIGFGDSYDDVTGAFVPGTTSMAACETYNQTKWALSQASQGDTVMCYVQHVWEAIAADANHLLHNDDIYDGDWHTYDLVSPEGEERPDLIRMRLTKDDDGFITGFTMFACKEGVQQMYLNQTIDTTTGEFDMTNISTYESPEGHGSEKAVVSGVVNELGYFEGTKNMTMEFEGQWGTDTSSGHMDFTQTEDGGSINGIMTGEYDNGDSIGTYENKAYSIFELVDSNTGDTYSIANLALGAGSAHYGMSGTCDECGPEGWEDSGTESWSASAGSPVEDSNDYTDSADDVDLLTAEDISEPSFGSNTVDCVALAADTDGEIDFEDLDVNPEAACEQVDHNHVDCWNLLNDQ